MVEPRCIAALLVNIVYCAAPARRNLHFENSLSGINRQMLLLMAHDASGSEQALF